MPAVPLNRTNAWEYWKTGRIAATNIDNLSIGAPGTPSLLRNLAVKHGYNAIRLWLGWAVSDGGKDYSVLGPDWITIGNKGWADTGFTARTAASGGTRIDEVAQQVQRVLDICESLGVGVILTGNFYSGKTNGESVEGRLWVDAPYSEAKDAFGLPIGPTTAQTMQDALVRFWQQTLLRFGQHNALIGLDLLNEPKPPVLDTLDLARFNSSRLNAWAPLAARLVKDLRRVDPSAASGAKLPRIPYIISEDMIRGLRPFLNTAIKDCVYTSMKTDTSYLVRDCTPAGALYGSLADDRIVYTIHTYRPNPFTHQGVMDHTYYAQGLTYPPNGLTREYVYRDEFNATERQVAKMQEFRTAAGWDRVFEEAIAMRAMGLPVFLGEFGAVEPNLDQVYPPRAGRESKSQEVNVLSVPTLGPSTDPAALGKWRQITQIDLSMDGQTYTFKMGNIDPWAEQMSSVDESISGVLGSTDYPSDGISCRVGSGSLNAAKWDPAWFRNDHAKATVHLYVNGAWLMTPLLADVQISLCNSSSSGGVSFTVPVNKVTGAKDQIQNATGAVKAALVLKSGRTPEEVSAARLAFTKDALRLCQRNGFSWAHFNESGDGPGFVGWRPTPAIRALLTKVARGDAV